MKSAVSLFKLLADPNRLRIALLLSEEELFVCQLMAILGISQPLVSRDLRQLDQAGLVRSLRRGKQVFYTLRDDLPPLPRAVLESLRREAERDPSCRCDRRALRLMRQRFPGEGTDGRCDMAAVRRFIDFRKRRQEKTNDKENHPWNY